MLAKTKMSSIEFQSSELDACCFTVAGNAFVAIYLLAIAVGDAIWDCRRSFFFFFLFFPPLLSGPYLWNRYSQRLQIECAAWSCCLILHYSLPSNSLIFFLFLFFIFFRHDFVGAISLVLDWIWGKFGMPLIDIGWRSLGLFHSVFENFKAFC